MGRIKFDLNESKIKLVKNSSESQFINVEIDVCRSGQNSHRMPISKEALKISAYSVKGVPILAEFVNDGTDVFGHGENEVAVGFVTEEEPNIIERDGELYLNVKAKLWKSYYLNLVEIFKKRNNVLEVSMEANIIEGEEPKGVLEGKIDLFSIYGVTLLSVRPSIVGSKATVLTFSEMKDIFIKETFGENQKQNELNVEEENELDFNTDNKTREEEKMEFSLTADQKRKILQTSLDKMDSNNSEYCSWLKDYDEEYMYAYIGEKCYKIPYTIQDDNSVTIDLTSKIEVLEGFVEMSEAEKNEFENFIQKRQEYAKENKTTEDEKDDEGEKDDDEEDDDEEVNKTDEAEEKKEEEKTDFEEKYNSLKERYAELEKENLSMKETLEKQSDYEELKKFQLAVFEKEKLDSEMIEMKKVMSNLENKGVKMSEKDIEDLYSKKSEFENVGAWSNYVKAFAFDNCEMVKEEDFVKMSYIQNSEIKKNEGIWNTLKNRV